MKARTPGSPAERSTGHHTVSAVVRPSVFQVSDTSGRPHDAKENVIHQIRRPSTIPPRSSFLAHVRTFRGTGQSVWAL